MNVIWIYKEKEMAGDELVVEYISEKLAREMKDSGKDQVASFAVLEYGMKIIVNAVLIIGLTMIISLLLGTLYPTMIAMVSFLVIRFVTGGIHIRSSDICVIVSVACFITVPFINIDHWTIIILQLLTFLIILIYSPSGMNLKIKLSWIVTRVIPIILILLNSFLIKSELLTITFFVQSLSILANEFKGDSGK